VNELTRSLLPIAFEQATGKRREKVTPKKLDTCLPHVWCAWRDAMIEQQAARITACFSPLLLSSLLDQVLDQIYEWNWNWENPDYDDDEACVEYAAYGLACIHHYRHNLRTDGEYELNYTLPELEDWLNARGHNGQLTLLDVGTC